MINQRLIPLAGKKEWEKAIQSLPHTFAYTHWYNQAMSEASSRDIFLYAAEAGDFRVICPLSPRRKSVEDPYDITSPYGFSGFSAVGKYANFPNAWHAFLQTEGFTSGHIALHPFFQNAALFQLSELFVGKKAYYLNLNPDLETLFQNFSTDHRQRLRQWIKQNFKIVISKDKFYIDAFKGLYNIALEDRLAARIYDFGDAAWNKLFAAEDAYLISVIVDDEVEASALFFLTQGIADYFMIASTQAGRLHARGVIWEGIKLCKKMNMEWLHLGCGINENDSLEQFKSRFGATAYNTYALKQIYNTESYRQLCEKYRTNPRELEGYFPSYWAV